MSNLQELRDTMSEGIFGMPVSEAHEKGICVDCKQPALANCYSDAGVREYAISGICEKCFDSYFEEE